MSQDDVMQLASSRLQVVIGSSWRLRRELADRLVASWTGPLHRSSEPADLDGLLLALDTPSLFEPAALHLLSVDARWLQQQAAKLMPLAGVPAGEGGVLVCCAENLPQRDRQNRVHAQSTALHKAVTAAGALHEADSPGPRQIQSWLIGRLLARPAGCEDPRRVAEALLSARGEDLDALLSAVDLLDLAAGDGQITATLAGELIAGEAGRPGWIFVGAVLEGRPDKALPLLHGHEALEPMAALGALAAELRLGLACEACSDDAQAAALAGVRGGPRVQHARRRAAAIGRSNLRRLLHGIVLAQRGLRRGGADARTIVEDLVLQARRVIRPTGR